MKLICFAFLLLAYSCLHAQTTTITLSKKFSLRDRGLTEKDGGTFRVGDFYYTTETEYKNMQLAYTAKLEKINYGINVFQFDQEMNELKKVSLDSGTRSFGPFPPITILFKGKILVFYYRVKEKGAIQLLFSELDPGTLDVLASKELYTISEKNVGLFSLAKAIKSNELSLNISPDSSKLVVAQSGNTNEVFTCVIDQNMEIAHPRISKVKGNMENFGIDQAVIDNGGNKYFSYSYTEDKLNKHGLLVQNNNGKEGFLTFKTTPDGLEPGVLSLKVSKDNSKVYVYGASVGEFLEEGVFLTTVDATLLKLGKQEMFAYPQELREQLYKMDYADKRHGNYSVKEVFFRCNELAGGTIVLTGYPVNTEVITTGLNMMSKGNSMKTYTNNFAGPIINIFIKDHKCNFGVIYRNQTLTPASGIIVIPYQDKLICLYNDSEKSIVTDDLKINGKVYNPGNLVLAEAVLNSDGTVISKKKIADKEKGLSYFINYRLHTSENTYLIPLGQLKANLMRYYTELNQWATLEIK